MNPSAIPSFGIVLRQQLRLLWLSRRPQGLGVILVGALIMMRAVIWWADRQIGKEVGLLFARVPVLVMVVAAGWALIVWRDDPPKQRRYHWSMPVDMAHHDLARVLAGALWLLAAISVWFVVGVLIALMDGQTAALADAAPGLVLYLTLAPLLMYLLLSGFGIASNRPLEWMLGLYVGFQAVIGIGVFLDRSGSIMRAARAVIGEPYGLGIALSGLEPSSSDTAAGPWVPVVLLWLAIAAAVTTLFARRGRGRA